jgi:hypothetical protein
MEMEDGDGENCVLLVRACLFACSRRRLLCIWFQLLELGFAGASCYRPTAPPHGVMEVSSDGAATACACGGLQG